MPQRAQLKNEAEGAEKLDGKDCRVRLRSQQMKPLMSRAGFRVIAWAILSGSLTLILHSQSFATPPKKTRAHLQEKKSTETAGREIYSAMEPEPTAGSRTPKKQTLKNVDQFETVPASQREPISRRLKLIEKLIVEHGRAYDYRTVTIAELNAILQHLNSPGTRPERLRSAEEPSDEDGGTPAAKKAKIQIPDLTANRPEAPPEESTESEEPEAPLPPHEEKPEASH